MLHDDKELPDDEEEILVYVEFDGSVASNTLSNEKLQLDMIGLDREHPIMQVNGKVNYFHPNFEKNSVIKTTISKNSKRHLFRFNRL